MDDFLKMDIFFVVTTVAVVITTLLLAVILIRVLRILKNVEDISVMVEEEGRQIRKDIADVRARVKDEGLRVTHFLDLIGLKKPRKRSKRSEPTT